MLFQLLVPFTLAGQTQADALHGTVKINGFYGHSCVLKQNCLSHTPVILSPHACLLQVMHNWVSNKIVHAPLK